MKCTSCPDAIARVIQKVVASKEFQAAGIHVAPAEPAAPRAGLSLEFLMENGF